MEDDHVETEEEEDVDWNNVEEDDDKDENIAEDDVDDHDVAEDEVDDDDDDDDCDDDDDDDADDDNDDDDDDVVDDDVKRVRKMMMLRRKTDPKTGKHFVRVCAVERHAKISQELLCGKFTGNMTQTKAAPQTLCEPAQTKCMSRFQSYFIRKFKGEKAFTHTIRTPQCGHPVWGKKHKHHIVCWLYKSLVFLV